MSSVSQPRAFGCACTSDTGHTPWWRILAGAFLAINSMTFALAINVSEATAQDRFALQTGLLAAAVAVTLLLGQPLLDGLIDAVRRRQVNMEVLFALSYAGAMIASFVSYVRGQGPVFFEVAGIVFVVYTFGREVGRYTQRRLLQNLAQWQPREMKAELILEGDDGRETYRNVPVSEIRAGDLVRVHPGRVIPVDGTIIKGDAFVREAELTGEAFAVPRHAGDAVFAGTHVWDATILVRASAPGTAREVDRIADVLERFEQQPSGAQLFASRVVRWFIPLLTLICAGTFVYWKTQADTATALFNAMSVLLVACPCALGVSTPIAVWTGLTRLGGLSLWAKSGVAVEKLASVDTVVFDKTGTLTMAETQEVRVERLPGCPVEEETLCAMIGAAERACDHPIAVALRQLESKGSGWSPASVAILPGRGLEAIVENGELRATVQIVTGKVLPGVAEKCLEVSVDGAPAAVLHLNEQQINGVEAIMNELRELNLRTALMTGDGESRARKLPIAEQYAEVTPARKHELVSQMEANGRRVLYVGDGINDAAAMAASTLSVAITSGSPLAQDVAGIELTNGDIARLPEAIRICRRVNGIIRSNLWLALGYNVFGMALAAAGMLHPIVATLLMTVSSCLVSWRALNLLNEGSEVQPAIVEAQGAAR